MLLTHAHIISPGLEITDGFVQVADGKIKSAGPMSEAPGEGIDLKGRMLLPGFIDIHSHGADGHDVCDASPEGLEHIARTKLKEGVTTWLPTTLTQPADRLKEIVGTVATWAPTAPLHVPGVHLEGPFINREQAGAQNPEFVRPPDPAELRELHEIFPALILSLAPELPGALDLIREARSLNIVPSAAHTKADYATIMDAIAYGLGHLTHFGNAMTGLHHREIGVVGAGLLEDILKLELIADGIHLAPEMLDLIFKKVPRENIFLITDSVSSSWRPDGENDIGGLPVIIKDGIARLKSNGALAGSTLRYPKGLQRVQKITGEPLQDLVATTSWNQAQALHLPGLGKIEEGFVANLTVMDDQFEVISTFVKGAESHL
ncbi:N-acetylglucosamine-6-phosphate deacetylase [Verrucomicrobiaceae bacterium 227]